eukprot:Gb_13804 [translate_table: standard]
MQVAVMPCFLALLFLLRLPLGWLHLKVIPPLTLIEIFFSKDGLLELKVFVNASWQCLHE